MRPHDFQSVWYGFREIPLRKNPEGLFHLDLYDADEKWEYNISSYQLIEKHLIGHTQAEWSHYDLINIVLVCLGSKSHKQLKGILRLLNMLLLDNISSQEKQKLLEKEFDVTMTPHLEKGVAAMCNLSEGIERRVELRGRKLGEEVGEKRGELRGRKIGEKIGQERGEKREEKRSVYCSRN